MKSTESRSEGKRKARLFPLSSSMAYSFVFLLGMSCVRLSAESASNGLHMRASQTDGIQTVSSSSSSAYITDFYPSMYFANLSRHFGLNVKGSCAYVAFGMLLSYWDTYWDDDFIPETYDATISLSSDAISSSIESPGVHMEESTYDDASTKYMSASKYYEFVEAYADTCHHLSLIKMAEEQFGLYDFSSYMYPCAMDQDPFCELVDYYLYDYLGMATDEVSVVSSESTGLDAREFAIGMIKHGIPVFLGMSSSSGTDGHAVVAYDYDSDNDIIYVNMGWPGSDIYLRCNPEIEGYDICDFSLAIVPSTSHSHTGNYVYTSGSSASAHCPCELGFTDFDDAAHTYGVTYSDYSSAKHRSYCICGRAYTLSSHLYGASYTVGAKTYANCVYCGHQADLTNTMVPLA